MQFIDGFEALFRTQIEREAGHVFRQHALWQVVAEEPQQLFAAKARLSRTYVATWCNGIDTAKR